MKEILHHSSVQEQKISSPLAGKMQKITSHAATAVKDILTFAFEPIAYEFRRMREEIQECREDIERSGLSEQEKGQLRKELDRASTWLQDAEDLHYNHFKESKPVVEVRHEITRRLQGVRGHLSLAS